MIEPNPYIIEAGAAADGEGRRFRPTMVVVRNGRIETIGTPDQIRREFGPFRVNLRLPDRLLLSTMVNAHAHLELTPMGPRPYGGDFIVWLMEVVRWRRGGSAKPQASGGAVGMGAAMSREAGAGVVGDIAGREEGLAAREAMVQAGVGGVSFLELIGLGGLLLASQPNTLQLTDHTPRTVGDVTLGLQPHAPYSTLPSLYESATDLALRRGLPVCTHLAELPEELEFIAYSKGPFRELWEKLGIWESDVERHYSAGWHPVRWLEPYMRRVPFLCAHVNYVDDDGIALLAKTKCSVAYCPIASDYFGHRGHRYREMLDAGINVCLGTDSILCQPPDEPQPLGILPQMRHLYQRDRTDPQLLLKMATVNGLRALHMQHSGSRGLCTVRFDPDDPTDPLTQVLQNRYPVEPLTLASPDPGELT